MESPNSEIVVPKLERMDSIGSFEEINTKVIKANDPETSGILKVDGKVPSILYVLKYVGWNNAVVECRQSDTPFKRIPLFKETDDITDEQIGEYSDEENEKPVFDIVYKINKVNNDQPNRYRNNDVVDRPITAAFDMNDYPYEDAENNQDENEASPPFNPKPTMNIYSEPLIHALQAVISYYPRVNLQGCPISIPAPYRLLYLHRDDLARYKDNQPKCHSKEYAEKTSAHIDVLLEFLQDNMGETLKREEALQKLAHPSATFDLFWLLLKPGSIFYTKRYGLWTPYVISSVRPGSNSRNEPYKIECWFIETNGVAVKRFMESFIIQPWTGEQVLTGLPIIPERFWIEDMAAQGGRTMREKCIEEGRLYWELLKKPAYMEYEGELVNPASSNRQDFGVTGWLTGRVICDAAGFDRFYLSSPDAASGQRSTLNSSRRSTRTVPPLDHLPRSAPRCGCESCEKTRDPSKGNDSIYAGFGDLNPETDDPPVSDVFYHVLSNTIPGFVLGSRRWASLNVANLKPVETNKDAFKDLVLENDIKTTVKALIGKFATGSKADRQLQPWNTDLVQNKGEGRIFLLHGTPGVGKTCTAECIAELSNRPLIAITSGDLGTDSYRVESNLNYFLDLGQRYGALLLLDEADVYLERRRSKDITRNGLVSIFLRALEYYRGVLFLTTNRVQAFDSAFLSRIHVALHYKNLRNEDRERIWASNFERLERESRDTVRVSKAARSLLLGGPAAAATEDEKRLCSLKWNGREIRNAMQTMLALAESQAREDGSNVITVDSTHVWAVVKMNAKFRDYLKKTLPVKGIVDVEVEGDSSDEEDE